MEIIGETGRKYRPRVIALVLHPALKTAGAIVIEGARASGKTMTALHAAKSYTFIDDHETQTILEVAPRPLLEVDRPRLLDEKPIAPELWNLGHRSVDTSPSPGQFTLTGSALPADDITRHTGAGRFLRLRQRTMSWWEKLDSPAGTVSLAGLFAGRPPAIDLDSVPSLESVIGGILRPSFPALTTLTPGQSTARLRGYGATSTMSHELTYSASLRSGTNLR